MLFLLPIILFFTSPYCSLLFLMLFPIVPHYVNISYSHNHILCTLILFLVVATVPMVQHNLSLNDLLGRENTNICN